jgi:hypothetical protein
MYFPLNTYFIFVIKSLKSRSRELLGGVCFQFFIIFISFQEIQKLDDPKSEKLKAPFYEILRFSLLGSFSF